MKFVIVSACLVGMRTRYDGRSRPGEKLIRRLKGKAVIPLCPEQLGGLPTPRPAAEITGGDGDDVLDGRARVINRKGEDVTAQFLRGAEEVVRVAKEFGVKTAYLKSSSPSCGVCSIKRGGKIVAGRGVCAASLARAGIKLLEIP